MSGGEGGEGGLSQSFKDLQQMKVFEGFSNVF